MKSPITAEMTIALMPFLLISTSAITWPAERLNLLRVDLSTSSGVSYAAGSYFVGVLPGWFVMRLGVISKTPLYQLVKY
ncbi:TPA: hypothetical protein RFS82_001908 [Klebsiella variicola]|nr:hypothetical protein [Klebsiella variicola]